MALPVVIVGAGPAGLAVSRELQVRNVDHVVLEQARLAQAWRDRWDSFTLVTPNWTLALPGYGYGGDDPQGHVPKSDIVAYLEQYGREMAGPVHEGVRVERLELAAHGAYRLRTSDGVMTADTVVVCTGAYQRTYRPAAFEGISHFDAMSYRSPEQLPAGPVLVVGSGQTGCQIAEELVLAGRDVFLSCGRATWVPRRIAGVDGRTVRFADDLAASVAFGDARLRDIRDAIRRLPDAPTDAPELADPAPFQADPIADVDLTGFAAVITTSGFRPDYARWVALDVFDDLGFPVVDDQCAAAPGLYFCGVHFLRTRKSSVLFGVGEDAAVVAEAVVRRTSGVPQGP